MGFLINNLIMSDLKTVCALGDADFTLKEQESYLGVCYKLIVILMDDYFFILKIALKLNNKKKLLSLV
jgi:hypothetical protein